MNDTSMILLSGKTVNERIQEELKAFVSTCVEKPQLAIVQVGDNPESNIYVSHKKKFGEAVGILVQHIVLPEDTLESDVVSTIKDLNDNPKVHGIIVQLPLPKHISKEKITNAIEKTKDVDGLSIIEQGLLYGNSVEVFVPATAQGIMTLFDFYNIPLSGKHVVVVGRSQLVGKPVALEALHRNATVTICHSHTEHLEDITRAADILIVATGIHGVITEKHVKEGQIVIDVGIHRTEKGLQGDVDFESVKDRVAAITPVPGGVGPLTVASLFQNVIEAYKRMYSE